MCLIGEPGTAKTVMIKNYMETFDKEKFVNRALSFSAETSPILFQVGFLLFLFVFFVSLYFETCQIVFIRGFMQTKVRW